MTLQTSVNLSIPAGFVSVTGDAPLTVSFVATPSGGTAPYTYAWDFGDGTSGTGAAASHTYQSPGTFPAKVVVTDATGTTSTVPFPIVVVTPPPPPLAAESSAIPMSGLAPLDVAFSGTASGGVAPYTYAWDFGDGTTGTGAWPPHTYAAAGTYSAVLTATDSAGSTAPAAPLSITVSAPPPPTGITVTVTAAPTSGAAPLKVALDAAAAGGKAPYSYAWAYGNGGTGSGAKTSCTYGKAGTFTAVATAKDSAGDKGEGSSPPIMVG